MEATIIISALTIVGSIGAAVFVSGKTVGKVCGQVDENTRGVNKNSHDIDKMRADFERVLNNGIRKDIAGIKAGLDVAASNLVYSDKRDEELNDKLTELAKCVGAIRSDVSYMKGIMNFHHEDGEGKK